MPAHDDFLELCAVSLTGELTKEERGRLERHLESCSSCREALWQYQATAVSVIPELASEAPLPSVTPDPVWSQQQAESALFARIAREQDGDSSHEAPGTHRFGMSQVSLSRGTQLAMLYAAGILLFLALAVCAYRIGEKRGTATTNSALIDQSGGESARTAARLAAQEKEVLLAEVAERDRLIGELKQRIAAEKSADRSIKSQQVSTETTGGPAFTDQSSPGEAAAQLVDLQSRLDAEEKKRAEEVARAASLEAKVAEVAKLLQEKTDEAARENAAVRDRDYLLEQRDATIAKQEELLAHDRDIRDLMSARDLYIAEVYDVNKTGETNKPYGRIFYTRGRSLLFYAYDLDQQVGLKKASAFQAWGRRQGGQNQPVSLGILYEDSAANKRWVVKSEDPKTLEQIDAVFVTVEPHGGSSRPSGKALLFASLRIHANHP